MGSWEWNLKTGQLEADALARELWNLPAAGLLAPSDAFARVHEEDVAALRTEADKAINSGSDYKREFRIVRHDQTIRWIAGKATVVRDASGAPEAIVGVTFDVTNEKEVEQRRQLISSELSHRMKRSSS